MTSTVGTGVNNLVGRNHELAKLVTALDTAISGNGELVMLVGEPGIGKTRLTQELISTSTERGAITALGACYEGGTTPPYWPWTQVIRSLLNDPSDAVLKALEPRAAVIVEIAPEITNRFPNITPLPEVDPGQARFRLFDSIATFLSEVTEHKPLIIALDDLHWADQSTLDLFEYVAREISSKQMLLVGGYRDTELGRRHPLSDSLAKIARVTEFQRIVLRGLELDEVGRMVQEIGNISISSNQTTEIHKRTEGNPFFVSEVARDMAKESAERGGNFNAMKFRIPEGVREAIGIRLNKLSDDCNEMLQTAAVIGREFDFTLLSMLKSEDSDKDELTLLEEAVAAATVREVPGQRNRYEFTHALFQQTLVEELTTGRRVRLHARVVDSMEQLYPENLSEHATEMLHHCTEGVVSANKIANYAQLAAVHAAHLNAWAEARAYCEQALEALGDRSPDFQRADILSLLGRGELLTFSYPDLQRGWNHVASAFKIYDDFEDHESAVSLIQRARGYRPIWLHSTAEVFLRALEMVEPNSEDAGYLLVQQAQALRFEEMDHDGAASALDRALAIAVESGNKHLETRVLLGLAANGGRDGDAEGAVELRRRAAVLAQETEQPVEEAEARRAVLTQLITEGDAGDSNRNIEEILELERLFGFETAIVFEQLRIALVSGNLENTRYFGELADRDHAGDSVIRILAGLGGWHRGDTTDLDSRFDDAHEESQFAPTLWQRASNASFLSLVAWNTNRPDDAVKAGDVVKSVISRPKLIPEIETFARIALSMSAILTGDKVEAAEQYKHLSRGRDSISGTTYYLAGDRILGALAKTAGMFDKSAAHFEDALVFCSDPSYRMEATWSCHGYAEMLLETISSSKRTEKSTSDLERAKEVLILGLNHARDIGTHPLESLLIALQEKAAALGATRPTRPDGLTNREVDVLRLIASGRSNQQISDELVVTLSTTASHVANILGKTDSSNRTEAAAYAMRHGLV